VWHAWRSQGGSDRKGVKSEPAARLREPAARLREILEKTHDNFNMVRKLREQAEEETRSVFNEYEMKKVEIAAQQKRMNTFQPAARESEPTALSLVREAFSQITSGFQRVC
jgi:murein L,D-transpeptidase YafK